MGILRRKFNKIFNRVKSREQKTKKSRKTSESSSATEGSTAYCISDAKLEKNYSKIGADQSKKIADVEYTVNFQLDRSPNNGYGKTQDEQSAIVLREIGQFGAKNQATSEGRLYDLDITLDECATDSSGYLSGDHLSKYHISLNASPALSPASLKYRTLSNGDWKQPEITVESTPELLSIYIPRYRQSTCPDLNIISRFKKHILETKYVTSIFELSNNGIRNLIGDVSTELDYFFKDFDLLGLACEIHWSIPERYRERNAERRLKDVLHVSLRENNRIILNLKERIGIDLPLSMLSAITEENCIRNHALESYQGIYRRYYAALLPLQHSETAVVHQDYWTLSDIQYSQKDPPQPNIGQFLYGHDAVKLDRGSLIALNIIGLKLARV